METALRKEASTDFIADDVVLVWFDWLNIPWLGTSFSEH